MINLKVKDIHKNRVKNHLLDIQKLNLTKSPSIIKNIKLQKTIIMLMF